MLILLSAALLFATALALLVIRLTRPQFRFAWLIAVGATFVVLILVLIWRAALPISITLGSWAPLGLLAGTPSLQADQFAWIFAISLVVLALATLLTATVREGFPDSAELSVSLALCGLGLLAVTAANPLTMVLVWAALDLAELAILLSAVGAGGDTRRA